MQAEAIQPGWVQRVRTACAAAFSRQRARSASATAPGIGVWLCEAYQIAVLGSALAYALVTAPGDFAYDFSMVHAVVLAGLTAVSIWLFHKRSIHARTFAIATTVACISLSVADMFLLGGFDIVATRLGATGVAALLSIQYAAGAGAVTYLAVSPRAKKTLSVPLDSRPIAREGHSYDVPMKQRVRTWVFWRDLMLYFIVFSFMGHWAEMLFCYNIYLGVVMGDVDFSEKMLWHQWLFPYCAEGIAVVLIAVLLTPIKQALLKRFGGRILPALLVSIVVTAVVCTSIDFTAGMVCNQNYEVWDYRDIPFNFMGQICLQNSTIYTIAATLILWVFYPLMDRGLRRLPRSFSDGLFFALLGIYGFEALLHFMYVGDAGLVVGDFEM